MQKRQSNKKLILHQLNRIFTINYLNGNLKATFKKIVNIKK